MTKYWVCVKMAVCWIIRCHYPRCAWKLCLRVSSPLRFLVFVVYLILVFEAWCRISFGIWLPLGVGWAHSEQVFIKILDYVSSPFQWWSFWEPYLEAERLNLLPHLGRVRLHFDLPNSPFFPIGSNGIYPVYHEVFSSCIDILYPCLSALLNLEVNIWSHCWDIVSLDLTINSIYR